MTDTTPVSEADAVLSEPDNSSPVEVPQGSEAAWESERAERYADAFNGVVRRRAAQDETVQETASRRENIGKRRVIAGRIALVVIALVLAIGVAPPLVQGAAKPVSYAVGARPAPDETRLRLVIDALWKVRAGMDSHLLTHEGFPPAGLDELKGIPPTCPATGLGWTYETDGRHYRVACPHPETVDRTDVSIDHRVGPPRASLRPAKEEK